MIINTTLIPALRLTLSTLYPPHRPYPQCHTRTWPKHGAQSTLSYAHLHKHPLITFSSQFENSVNRDCTVKVGDKEWTLDKAVLSNGSRYFYGLFRSGLQVSLVIPICAKGPGHVQTSATPPTQTTHLQEEPTHRLPASHRAAGSYPSKPTSFPFPPSTYPLKVE